VFLRRIERPRLGRAALAQADRQQHVHPHLQEFAFPVLERGADEMTRGQVVPEIERRASVLDQLLVVHVVPCYRLPDDEHCSERSTSDRPLRFHMQHLVQVTPRHVMERASGRGPCIRESCASSA
jgi:hypothetical protein